MNSLEDDVMKDIKLLLSVADSYHDFAGGTRCGSGFPTVKADLAENECLYPVFQNGIKDSFDQKLQGIFPYIVSPGGAPTTNISQALSASVFKSEGTAIKQNTSLDYEGAVMGFLNEFFESHRPEFTQKYFDFTGENYFDESTDTHVHCIAYKLQGTKTNIAELKALIYDFFSVDSTTDRRIGIMTDCIQNPKIVGQIFDDFNSSSYKGIVNLYSVASMYDRATNKIKQERYNCLIKPKKGDGYELSIGISNTNRTDISFIVTSEDNYPSISINQKGCVYPKTLVEQLTAEKQESKKNGQIRVELLEEILSTTDMSVANLCKVIEGLKNNGDQKILDKIISAGSKGNPKADIFKEELWKLLQYCKNEAKYDPKFVMYDIKRSMDYGQVEFIRAMRLLRDSNEFEFWLQDSKVQNPEEYAVDMNEFSEFVLITFDRLCYTKCRVEGVPCIYIKNTDTLLLTKPRIGAESIDDVMGIYGNYGIINSFKENTLQTDILNIQTTLSTYFDTFIDVYTSSLVNRTVIDTNLWTIKNESENGNMCLEILRTLDWNLKRFHILYLISLIDLKQVVHETLNQIQTELDDKNSDLMYCLKEVYKFNDVLVGGALKRQREENDDTEPDAKRPTTQYVFKKVNKVKSFHTFEKLFSLANQTELKNTMSSDQKDIEKLIASIVPFLEQLQNEAKREEAGSIREMYASAQTEKIQESLQRDMESLIFKYPRFKVREVEHFKTVLNQSLSEKSLKEKLSDLLTILDLCFDSENLNDYNKIRQEIDVISTISDNSYIVLNKGNKKKQITTITWNAPKNFLSETDFKNISDFAKLTKFSGNIQVNGQFESLMQILTTMPDMKSSGKPSIMNSVARTIDDSIVKPGSFRIPRFFMLNKILNVSSTMKKDIDGLDEDTRIANEKNLQDLIQESKTINVSSLKSIGTTVVSDNQRYTDQEVNIFSKLIEIDTKIENVIQSINQDHLKNVCNVKTHLEFYHIIVAYFPFSDILKQFLPNISKDISLFKETFPEFYRTYIGPIEQKDDEINMKRLVDALLISNNSQITYNYPLVLDIEKQISEIKLDSLVSEKAYNETRYYIEQYKNSLSLRLKGLLSVSRVLYEPSNVDELLSIDFDTFVTSRNKDDFVSFYYDICWVLTQKRTIQSATNEDMIKVLNFVLNMTSGNQEPNRSEIERIFEVYDEKDLFSFKTTKGTMSGGAGQLSVFPIPKFCISDYSSIKDILGSIPAEDISFYFKDKPIVDIIHDLTVRARNSILERMKEYYEILSSNSNDYKTISTLDKKIARALEIKKNPPFYRNKSNKTIHSVSSPFAIKQWLALKPDFISQIKQNSLDYLSHVTDNLKESELSQNQDHICVLDSYKLLMENSTSLSDSLNTESDIYMYGSYLIDEGLNLKIYTRDNISGIDGKPYSLMIDYDIINRFDYLYSINDRSDIVIDDMIIYVKCLKDIIMYFNFKSKFQEQDNMIMVQSGGVKLDKIVTDVLNENSTFLIQTFLVSCIFIFVNFAMVKHLSKDPKTKLVRVLVNTAMMLVLLFCTDLETTQHMIYILYFVSITIILYGKK